MDVVFLDFAEAFERLFRDTQYSFTTEFTHTLLACFLTGGSQRVVVSGSSFRGRQYYPVCLKVWAYFFA